MRAGSCMRWPMPTPSESVASMMTTKRAFLSSIAPPSRRSQGLRAVRLSGRFFDDFETAHREAVDLYLAQARFADFQPADGEPPMAKAPIAKERIANLPKARAPRCKRRCTGRRQLDRLEVERGSLQAIAPSRGAGRHGRAGKSTEKECKSAHHRSLIQSAAEAEQRQPHGGEHEDGKRGNVHLHVGEAVPLQHDAADDADEMSEREHLADPLRPVRHAAEREGEARQQEIWQEEEERHLHGLELILGDSGECIADGEV